MKRFNFQLSIFNFQLVIACLVAATMCFSCIELNPEPDDPNGGDGGDGGYSGKRIRTMVLNPVEPDNPECKWEHSYNSDGTMKQIDAYGTSNLIGYTKYVKHSNGLRVTGETWMEGLLVVKTEYEYNNKTLSKTSHNMGFGSSWTTVNYHTHTFENGRKVKQEFYSSGTLNKTFIFSYDGSGKRTKTTVGQVEYVRSYNTDGTIKDVVYTKNGKKYTLTFTWEDGKSTENPDDYLEN